MKYFAVTVLGAIFAFLLADFMLAQPSSPQSTSLQASLSDAGGNATAIAFKHALHGDSIGLDCAHCHTGAKTAAHAYMPSKSDCIDCHRLPLTENPGIETLDSALSVAPSEPWVKSLCCQTMCSSTMESTRLPEFLATNAMEITKVIRMAAKSSICGHAWLAIVAKRMRPEISKGQRPIARLATDSYYRL